MELFVKKEDCCGCTACENVCPQNAIAMKPDREGFLYPEIDASLCTECGLCKDVCAFHDGYDVDDNLSSPDIYAAKHKKEGVLLASSSGGMFTAISDHILAQNGVIYGVVLDENLCVRHGRAVTPSERDRFRGSKYVQSDLDGIFAAVKRDLADGRRVLFSGTPCQTAALIKFVGDSDNLSEDLFICDLFCHAVPSPLIWKDYLHFIEKYYKSEVINYQFRSKLHGWGVNFRAEFDNGKSECGSIPMQTLRQFFLHDCVMRPSCHVCPYFSKTRPSDITLGDFWGVQYTLPDFFETKGVSAVLLNSKKGRELFENIKSDIYFEKSSADALTQKEILDHPYPPSPLREQIWNDYFSYGFDYIAEKYAGLNVLDKIRDKKVVIFDAASVGIGLSLDPEVFDRLLFFIDNDVRKQKSGVTIDNMHFRVYSPSDAVKLLTDDVIILLPNHRLGKTMKNELLSLSVKNEMVLFSNR